MPAWQRFRANGGVGGGDDDASGAFWRGADPDGADAAAFGEVKRVVADDFGMPADQVFKTLVVRGDRTGVLLACIPGSTELNLKAVAAASGNKKVELVAVKEVLGLTGYIRGGVSPIGTKKPYPLYLDETAELWDIISVSAGMRGLQMLVAPDDLVKVAGATKVPLT